MHPRITRLYVNNYRSFVNFELRPGRRSLLLGYNGTGKSSVFDVLHGIRALVIGNNDIKHVFPTDTVTKFGGSPEQRFDPRAPLSPIASFKSFLEACLACFNASAWRSTRCGSAISRRTSASS